MLIRLYVTGCGNPVRAGGIAAAVSSPLDQRLADIRSQRAIESWNRHATPMGYIYPRSPIHTSCRSGSEPFRIASRQHTGSDSQCSNQCNKSSTRALDSMKRHIYEQRFLATSRLRCRRMDDSTHRPVPRYSRCCVEPAPRRRRCLSQAVLGG